MCMQVQPFCTSCINLYICYKIHVYTFMNFVYHVAVRLPNKNSWTKISTFFCILLLTIFLIFFIVCFPLLVVSLIGALHVPVAIFLLLSITFIHYCVVFFLPIFVFVFPFLFLLVPLLLLFLRFLLLSSLRIFRLERRSADIFQGRFLSVSVLFLVDLKAGYFNCLLI